MRMIRELTSDKDIDLVANLARVIWHEYFRKLISIDQIDYMLDKFQSSSAIKQAIEFDNYKYFGIYNDDELAGYIGIQIRINDAYLSKFYLNKKYRGLGLGKELMDKAISYALENDVLALTLNCNKYNEDSLEIYKHLGFKIKASTVNEIGEGFVMDDYILSKNLELINK
ncbi:MAG: GNAT family N-acetyltransferase [Erysipelotrichaceae bacterium]